MARESGVFQFPANFEVEKAAPLDARQACGLLSDMYVLPYQFKGMIVSVTDESQADDNGTYVCINPAQPGGTSADVDWEKLGSGTEGAQGATGPSGVDGQGVIGGDEDSPYDSDSTLFPEDDPDSEEITNGTFFIGSEGTTWVFMDGSWSEVGDIVGPPGPITLAGDEDDPNDASGLPAPETLIDGQMYIGSEGTTWIWDSLNEEWSEVGNIGGPTGPQGANGTTLTQWSEDSNGHILPSSTETYDIGSATQKVRHLYLSDTSLYVGNSWVRADGDKIKMPALKSVKLNIESDSIANDVDGTVGDWEIQAGATDLFLIDNLTGRKYKFNLTEIEE